MDSRSRLLCSKVDENAKLTNLPRNKSVTLLTKFTTTDVNLSPVLDTMNGVFRFLRNRLNEPIEDFANDPRSNRLVGDPHAACYISQKVNLKQASTSLKVLVSAYRHTSADFRVLYKLSRTDSSNIEQTFELFPGFDNTTDTDGDGFGDKIINPINNSGRPDSNIPASADDEFFDYQFSIDELEQFNGFQIKIVMSGTNEAKPPRFKDLRVIALA